MIFPLFEKILESQKAGYAFLSQELKIQKYNSSLIKFLENQISIQSKSIFQVLPETVGLENILQEMILEKRDYFKIEYLNREIQNNIIYFKLSFFRNQHIELPICCIIEDISCAAAQKLQLRQQKYEIILLKRILDSRGEIVAGDIIGNSPPIQKLRQIVDKVSYIPSATVLLYGESGSGKNVVAKTIHYASPNKDAPFVEINCAAIPENLLESELFGYEKGAFTHATTSKPGLLEEADNGTLFLDEIGEMSFKLQAKLLSFLESKKFRRLGSNNEINVNVRLITATHCDINEMVKDGKFREDLYYRLHVVKINLPPLRTIGDDIIKIAHNFIDLFNSEFGKHIKALTPEAITRLKNYSWPGNVRELRNVIERAMIFAENELLESNDLQIGQYLEEQSTSSFLDHFYLPEEGFSFEEIEKKIFKDALHYSNGNQSKAAKLLHLSRDTFRYRLEKYNMI